MRRLLYAAAMVTGLLLAIPARASDLPLHEAYDRVLGAELVAVMLEAQLERLRDATTNPDVQVLVFDGEPVLIDQQRVDDLVFVGQMLTDASPTLRDAVHAELQATLGPIAKGLDFMSDSAVAGLGIMALKQKLAEIEQQQAAELKQEVLLRENQLSQLKFMIDVWWKDVYPDYIDMEVEFRGYDECKWNVQLLRTGELTDFDFATWRVYNSVWTWVPSTHHCGAPDLPNYQTPYKPAQQQYEFPMAANYDTGMYDLRRIDGNLDIGADCKYYGNPHDPRIIDGDWGCESGFKTHGRRVHFGTVKIVLDR
jgi:hypothetical protein